MYEFICYSQKCVLCVHNDLDLWPPNSVHPWVQVHGNNPWPWILTFDHQKVHLWVHVDNSDKFEENPSRRYWNIALARPKWCFARSLQPWPLTFDHQNRSTLPLSPNECLCQICRSSVKALLRYCAHKNGTNVHANTNGRTYNLKT